MESFQDRLRIRFQMHHARCNLCMKHRLIIRKCGHQQSARKAQMELLQRHLARQYRDRQCYWHLRASSRLEAANPEVFTICGILDSMDVAKHAWPRTPLMLSKQLCTFNRPKLTSTTFLIHGHHCTINLSPHCATANSSRTLEIVNHSLTVLASRIDLRCTSLHLQADNCSREVKNQTLIWALALYVSRRQLHSSQLGFLSSGHSHEDIDGMFALLRRKIEDASDIPTPAAFTATLQEWLDAPENRPNETHYRKAIWIPHFRGWMLGIDWRCHCMRKVLLTPVACYGCVLIKEKLSGRSFRPCPHCGCRWPRCPTPLPSRADRRRRSVSALKGFRGRSLLILIDLLD